MEKSTKKLAELTQRSFPARTQTLALFEDRMELTVTGPFERFRVPFYLHAVKEEPDLVVPVPWRALLLSLAALAAGAALAFLRARSGDLAAGSALATAGGLGVLLALPRLRRLHVYFYKAVPGADASRVTFEPQLYLFPDRPSRDEVRRFEELLKISREKQVEKARVEQEEGLHHTRELERFSNLRRDEILTQEEFEQVKAKLLNIKPRRIGF